MRNWDWKDLSTKYKDERNYELLNNLNSEDIYFESGELILKCLQINKVAVINQKGECQKSNLTTKQKIIYLFYLI